MLNVNEIFKSIQGESSFAGLPCIFIRLTGCNLRCNWCDTEYAFHQGTARSVQEILDAIQPLGVSLVEITGGEPLLQDEVYGLIDALLDRKYQVLLETGGSLSLERVPPQVVKVVDVKCPGSGESAHNRWDNLQYLNPGDEVKFVILDRADYVWSREVLKRHQLDRKAQVLFSPVYGKLDLKDLAQWTLEDNLPVRLQTQLHKVIWGKDAVGV
ncbi:MAG: radical SAM protein [Nitrospinaceae bacterium]|nr:radical SAM protein [Nitrospinaceae bacterium]NIR53520.1 radical SAM protein [Nitrospinaceae bacterium]NIS83919.1 radical SAM protein [Nitrospinaceae bacterium]NIT80727.1 radical SAM protein [Nitrospinaceae bacterium]NIU43036.1 radical SAM protein [Nitrospinaceae bacterium]